MANACTICNHFNRLEIDRALVAGRSHAGISREFGVSDDALRNHMENHLSRQLIKSHELKKAMESGNLLNEIEDLLTRSKSIMKKAEEDGRLNLALNAIKETRGTLELMSKIAVTLHQIRAQELEVERMQNNAGMEIVQQEGLERLSADELYMLMLLHEKMAGGRNDDVIAVTLEQCTTNITYTPQDSPQPRQRTRRTRQPGIVVDEEWPEEQEPPAQEFIELEEEPLEPLASLDLRDSPRADTWGGDDPFERMNVPGSTRTSIPGFLDY